MGAIYQNFHEIPPAGQHELFAVHMLDGLVLNEDEGAVIIGSYANDAWNVRSDIDMFVHTSTEDRVAELRTAARTLSAEYRVGLEFHCEAIRPDLREQGGYYNAVRLCPRTSIGGLSLRRGVEPNLVIGETIRPFTPASAYAFLGRRWSRIRETFEDGKLPADMKKEAQKGLELPGKIAVRAAELDTFGFDASGLFGLLRSEDCQTLLELDAVLTAKTLAVRDGAIHNDAYEQYVSELTSPAAHIGWSLLRAAAERLAELIETSAPVIPIQVTSSTLASRFKGVFEAIHRRSGPAILSS